MNTPLTPPPERPVDNNGSITLQGVSICPGIAIGRIRLLDADISIPQNHIDVNLIAAEQERYTRAVDTAKQYLSDHVANMHSDSTLEAQAIFEIHQAILADESFHDLVRDCIKTEQKCTEFCLNQEAQAMISKFNAMRNSYLQSRGEDIRDMAQNLLGFLAGKSHEQQHPIKETDILVSRHLHSSDVIRIHQAHACGFASASNALASHAAILLKGFGIPSIGGIEALLDAVHEGDQIILDGDNGILIARPSGAVMEEYEARRKAEESRQIPTRPLDCISADGKQITLRANIENPDQTILMLAHGLDGIGLFRTEFLISSNGHMPSEAEQYSAYRTVVEAAAGRHVTIRTFDIGGDKQMGLACRCTGRNPSLGIRGIRRHLMVAPDELRIQLRAILRAAHDSDVALLIPMVTTLDDIEQTKQLLAEEKQALREECAIFLDSIKLGVMIETPAAAIATGAILPEVDFINLGTNDLLQYFMAADRDNEQVVHYNDPTTPSFLWLLQFIIDQAKEAGREEDVAICGELASDPRMLPHLLRMGYRSFSLAPVLACSVRTLCAKEPTR